MPQLATAVRTAIAGRRVGCDFPREMLWERLAFRSWLPLLRRCPSFSTSLQLGMSRLVFFQLKLHLLQLDDDLLAIRAEDDMTKLLDRQLQVLDMLAARAQLVCLLRESDSVRIEFGFKKSNLLVTCRDQRCQFFLMSPHQRQQLAPIQVVQIRQRSVIH